MSCLMALVEALCVVGAPARQLFSLGSRFSLKYRRPTFLRPLSCVKSGSNQSVTSDVLGGEGETWGGHRPTHRAVAGATKPGQLVFHWRWRVWGLVCLFAFDSFFVCLFFIFTSCICFAFNWYCNLSVWKCIYPFWCQRLSHMLCVMEYGLLYTWIIFYNLFCLGRLVLKQSYFKEYKENSGGVLFFKKIKGFFANMMLATLVW